MKELFQSYVEGFQLISGVQLTAILSIGGMAMILAVAMAYGLYAFSIECDKVELKEQKKEKEIH